MWVVPPSLLRLFVIHAYIVHTLCQPTNLTKPTSIGRLRPWADGANRGPRGPATHTYPVSARAPGLGFSSLGIIYPGGFFLLFSLSSFTQSDPGEVVGPDGPQQARSGAHVGMRARMRCGRQAPPPPFAYSCSGSEREILKVQE